MTTLAEVWDIEPCAWLVGRDTYWRPCEKPSEATATDGRITSRLCRRHLGRALEAGWREVVEP